MLSHNNNHKKSVKYPAAWQYCILDVSLPAAGLFLFFFYFCAGKTQLFQLLFVYKSRRLCHKVGSIFYFRECDHFTDAVTPLPSA